MASTVSAPGKLMLLGEHAVVYGRPCIVTAVGMRMELAVSPLDKPYLEIESPDIGVTGYAKPLGDLGKGEIPPKLRLVETAAAILLEKYPARHGFRIEFIAGTSPKYGIGSSSTSVVCAVKALNTAIPDDKLFGIAYRAVIAVQGKGSGFDVAAAIHGGTLYFVAGGKVREPLQVADMPLMVAYSGVKADTVALVNRVAGSLEREPEKTNRIFDAIAKLVEDAKIQIGEGDWERVGRLMDFNQDYLRNLGVSTQKLEAMISAAKGAGAWGAKLSGAGGGDCMIALVPPEKRQAVVGAITAAGGQVIEVAVNAEGVKIEND